MRVNRRRVWIIAILALLAVIVILAGIKAAQIGTMIKAGKSFAPPPEAVTSAKVEQVEWQASRPAVGTLVGAGGHSLIRSGGLVREIGFARRLRQRDDMLVKLDTSVEEAQLAAARADADLARANLARARALRAAGSNAPADLDVAESRARAAGRQRRDAAGHHRQEDHPGSLRWPAVDPAGRAGAGDDLGDTDRLAAVDRFPSMRSSGCRSRPCPS